MELKSVHELFILEIKDLYSAENQLIVALPRMAKRAFNPTLKEGFIKHLEQTKDHAARLKEISDNLEFNPKGHVCKAMKGLIDEGKELIDLRGDSSVIDAGLIGAAQRVEHYEIAAYTSAIEFAEIMGHKAEAELLKKTLEEETDTSKSLLKLANTEVNKNAFEANRQSE